MSVRKPSQTLPKTGISWSIVSIFVLLAVFCAIASIAVWAVIKLPDWAAEQFGPASDRLEWKQKTIYSLRLYLQQSELETPLNPVSAPRPFTIQMGEAVDSISMRLQQEDFIRSSELFTMYLIYSGLDTSLQAGEYELDPALNMIQIARLLQDATPKDVTFGILPGWRAEEIAGSLATSGLSISSQEFLDLVHDPAGITLPTGWPSLPSLEGFMYPGTYEIPRQATATQMIELFLNEFDRHLSADVRQGFSEQGLDLYQAITLASMIQREAILEDEKPLIASVFYNRIALGMKLESDPTVQYAIGFDQGQNNWWKSRLTAEDLAFDSPYNTYLYFGFPPGPICNPVETSLKAVAFPIDSGYYYFQAACDQSGRHNFAVTFDEHLQNNCP